MTDPVEVLILRLPAAGDDVDLPAHQSAHAAGADLHAAVERPLTLRPGDIALIPCGFAIALPHGWEAQVRPRSGLATRHGISMPNAPGTIDSDYRGQVMVPLINHARKPFIVRRNMRIAQMLIKPVYRIAWKQVAELPPTGRAAGGFGHTGH